MQETMSSKRKVLVRVLAVLLNKDKRHMFSFGQHNLKRWESNWIFPYDLKMIYLTCTSLKKHFNTFFPWLKFGSIEFVPVLYVIDVFKTKKKWELTSFWTYFCRATVKWSEGVCAQLGWESYNSKEITDTSELLHSPRDTCCLYRYVIQLEWYCCLTLTTYICLI